MEMMSEEDESQQNGIQINFQPQNPITNSNSGNSNALENDSSFSKPIHASTLRDHIQHLLDAKDPNYPEINGFDVEFNYIETQTAQEQYFGDYKTALININKNKNRYSNVLPPEKTRVKLKVEEGEEGSDFINANFISGLVPKSERAYVATQGPLQATFGDFWKMVWQVDAVVIIMLTKEVENGKLKCDRYWPDVDIPLSVFPFKVTLESQDDTNSELTTRKFILQHIPSDESRTIYQFQYTAWPDHCLPVSTTAFLDLAHKADTANTTNGPIIVHCSAGIGRSGTFCTVHSIVEKLRLDIETSPDKDPEFNIVKTVLFMRQQRPGMVQTKEQYMFCYLTLLEECERLFSNRQQAKSIANDTLEEVANKTDTNMIKQSKSIDSTDSTEKTTSENLHSTSYTHSQSNPNQLLFSLSTSNSDEAKENNAGTGRKYSYSNNSKDIESNIDNPYSNSTSNSNSNTDSNSNVNTSTSTSANNDLTKQSGSGGGDLIEF